MPNLEYKKQDMVVSNDDVLALKALKAKRREQRDEDMLELDTDCRVNLIAVDEYRAYRDDGEYGAHKDDDTDEYSYRIWLDTSAMSDEAVAQNRDKIVAFDDSHRGYDKSVDEYIDTMDPKVYTKLFRQTGDELFEIISEGCATSCYIQCETETFVAENSYYAFSAVLNKKGEIDWSTVDKSSTYPDKLIEAGIEKVERHYNLAKDLADGKDMSEAGKQSVGREVLMQWVKDKQQEWDGDFESDDFPFDFYMADFKDEPKYGRQIIDDSFCPDGPLPRCTIEDSEYISENERQQWHNANERFAACASMYKWLDEQGILKEKAFCYDVILEQNIQGQHYDKQINFAIDSKDLMEYRDAMLASGVPNADKAVAAILAEEGHTIEPSHLTGATCLTWTMQSYRDNGGCVGRSWETPHEQSYYIRPGTGIGNAVDNRYKAEREYETGTISEDEYFDVIKDGAKSVYKLDREAFLTNVPKSFLHAADEAGHKSVMLPCSKDISASGYMELTVDSLNIFTDEKYDYETNSLVEGDTYTIALGDFEADSGAMVVKINGDCIKRLPVGMSMNDVARCWYNTREYINDDGSDKTFFELSDVTRNDVVSSLAEKAVQKSYLKQDVVLSPQESELVDIYKKQKTLHDSLGSEVAVMKYERDNPDVFREYNAYSAAISKTKAEHGIQNDMKQAVAAKEDNRELGG